MRLSPILVREMASAVVDGLLGAGHVKGEEQAVFELIFEVLDEDLRIEEEIEEEAKKLMHQHRRAIRNTAVDTKLLFQKLKRELAEKKGRVL